MESGSSSQMGGIVGKHKGSKLRSVLPKIEPFAPRKNFCDPRELGSWAKKTGFVSTALSVDGGGGGEATSSRKDNNGTHDSYDDKNGIDLEKGAQKNESLSPSVEIDPILARNRRGQTEIEPANGGRGGEENGAVRDENERRRVGFEHVRLGSSNGGKGESSDGNRNGTLNGNGHKVEPTNGNGQQVQAAAAAADTESKKECGDAERDLGTDGGFGGLESSLEMKSGMNGNPGYVPLILYGLQHYLSLAGSLIFIPLIMVPTMGGTDKDTATVISTMLLVSGVTTILQSLLGTRLPLIQGSSFVYLAPALVIMNSQEYRNLTGHKFRHIMRELQGAIIVGSISQSILGFTGLMSLLLRFINPVVVAPTMAALGLAFITYGFPQAGGCIEISLPQIILVLIFSLYLRGVSVFGHRVFCIYAVPLSVVIIWGYAFFLTAGGAYSYRGCSPDIPSSNIIMDACIKHAYTMKHCRTDISNAMRTAAWVRIPYPLQWGVPIFRLRTSIIMIMASLVASVDSIATYHSVSVRTNLKPPTPAVVSRGIALEGLCSVLAGLWGSGTGSTTLTENLHAIDAAKVANRRALQFGAVFLILFSFIGKVGAILASIPQALAASVLCFVWALIVALGLSTLQHTQSASSRNIIICGVSLFLGLSIPAYFQQYQPKSSLILPSYLVPYAAASDGPAHTGSTQIDFAINALMSLNMVVTLLVAFILDNTVPGSSHERGVYKWSTAEDMATDPSSFSDYILPSKVAKLFCWAKCLGV